jgi:hypothetical protein
LPALDIAWEDIFYVPIARVAALHAPTEPGRSDKSPPEP